MNTAVSAEARERSVSTRSRAVLYGKRRGIAAISALICGLTLGACSRSGRAKGDPSSNEGAPVRAQDSVPALEPASDGGGAHGAGHATRRPSKPSAGCGRSGARTGDFHLQTTDGAGTAREYSLVVPASYDAKKPIAVTFVYHGANADENSARGFGLQDAPGAADASIFVFPRGIQYQHYGVGWNDECGGYDMGLFDHLLDQLSKDYCIDENAVFAAGFSWGGDHVTSLACCRGTRVRAVAASSCTDEFTDPKNYKTYPNLPCPNSATTALRFTFDSNGDGLLSAQQFASTKLLFRDLNRCSSSSTAAGDGCVSYQGCAEPFLECGRKGIGHALPPGWANDTWRFLAGFIPAPAPAP
jgi:poly(3-hydroxybutyrate) depolymerase